jgi:methionyl-tRNA synthetase
MSTASTMDQFSAHKKVLITSALPYVNNTPHLGNLIGSSLSADVYARYSRGIGQQVLFICGTDEYGTTSQIKASEEKVTPQALCDKYYQLHKEIYDWFDLSFDTFGRTTTKQHTQLSQDLFTALYRQGYLIEKTLKQQYCDTCCLFLADRLVEGTCPHCSYGDARGDQCDQCQRLLDPEGLLEPRCKLCRNTPVLKSSDHLFLDLPRLQQPLTAWIESALPEWSRNAAAITTSWLRQGLEPRCITRDLSWGVPVPLVDPKLEKFLGKVLYSWFEAPMGYVSITACHSDKWREWWQDPSTRLVQFMGKDNVPFHTIVFPASLLGSGDPYIRVRQVAATEYLNYEDGKFSKSRNVGVFGNDAMQSGIPVEVWRYYLVAVRPENADSVFSWKDLHAKVNSELVNKLGNLVHRVLAFVNKMYSGEIPKLGQLKRQDEEFIQAVNTEIEGYHEAMSKINLREGLSRAMAVAGLGNRYLSTEQPWFLVKTEPERAKTVCNVVINLIRVVADLIEPVMPSITRKIYGQLEVRSFVVIPREFELTVQGGWKIGENPMPLFVGMTDGQVEGFRKKFGGSK